MVEKSYVLRDLNIRESDLEYIGRGKSAYVYRWKGTEKIIKIFLEESRGEFICERKVYETLGDEEGFLKMYVYGENYLVLDYIQGKTLYKLLREGVFIKAEYIEKVAEYVENIKRKGLHPNDLHLKNILIDGEERVWIVDLARFLDKKRDKRWDHLYWVYWHLYRKRWFPKRWKSRYMDYIVKGYKWIESIWVREVE